MLLPLSGIRVLDFTWAGTGPFGTSLLGFLGAEIIKVETRDRPDSIRRFEAIHGWSAKVTDLDASPYFHDLNLNKQSISLNLKKPGGRELVEKLIKISDIVVENMTPGVFNALVGDYRQLNSIRPGVIMASLSAVGATQGEQPGYAAVFAARGGLSWLSGYEDGPSGHMRLPVDLTSGAYLALGMMAALWERSISGKGQYVDLSCQEVTTCLVGDAILRAAAGLGTSRREGNRHPDFFPHDCYPSIGEDQWISIVVRDVDEWRALCDVIGGQELKVKSLENLEERRRQAVRINDEIAAWTRTRTKEAAFEILTARKIPAMPTFTFADLVNNPHLTERGFWQESNHPVAGSVKVANPPWKFLSRDTPTWDHAGMMGEHNERVLMDLVGLDRAEFDALVNAGVVEPATRPEVVNAKPLRPPVVKRFDIKPAKQTSKAGALCGISIVELGDSHAVQYAGRLLCDLGARVFKVEDPHTTRREDAPGITAFCYENAGKESITIDTSRPSGRELLTRLVKGCDLLLTDQSSLPVDTGARDPVEIAKKLGVSILSVRPYGSSGPYADLETTTLNIFSAGGEGYLFPPTIEYASRPPVMQWRTASDYASGSAAAVAALAGVFARRQSGVGEYIDFSCQEFGISLNRLFSIRYQTKGVVESRVTQAHPWAGAFECIDGEVTVLCQEEHQWRALADGMGLNIAEDPRFNSPAHRRAHGDELKPIVAAWMKAHTRAEVVEIMKQVPLGVIRTPEQVLEAPEFAARGFLQSLQVGSHQGAAPGLPFVLSRTPSRIAGAAPRVGEHTRRVLMEELGLSGEKVAELHASSVI